MDMSAIPITFYSLREAATVLGVDYCTARGLLVNGQLRGFQIGRRWRVQPADIQAFIDEGKVAVQRRAATAKSIHDSIGGSTWPSESAARPGGSTSPRQVAIALEDRLKQLTARRPRNCTTS